MGKSGGILKAWTRTGGRLYATSAFISYDDPSFKGLASSLRIV